MRTRSRSTKPVRLILAIAMLVLSVGAAGQYPSCSWKCEANDVAVTVSYVEGPGTCALGQSVHATLYVEIVNGTNTPRYAVRLLGDLYVDGRLDRSFDTCVLDSMSPGTQTIPLATVSYPCGAALDFRRLVVSWSSSRESCSETPTCASRTAKCWSASSVAISGTALSADFSSNSPICYGEIVQFASAPSGGVPPYALSWAFGDGVGTSSAGAPSYAYSAPGSYTATLLVTDSHGTSVSVTHPVVVHALPTVTAANAGPYRVGDTIQLSSSGGLVYSWVGPNGFKSALQNPVRLGATEADSGVYVVTATNAAGCSAQASTTVIVDENTPPTASAASTSLLEDTPTAITLVGTDPDGDPLEYAILTPPSHGTISAFDPATGALVYTPHRDYHGPDSFTFQVCDPAGACSSATITLTVMPVGDAPTAFGSAVTTLEDVPLAFGLSASDPDGDLLNYSLHTPPSHGAITSFDSSTGQLVYTPDPHYNGPDAFTFEACDPTGLCHNATVTVTVVPVNDPPVALDQTRTIREDTPSGFFALAISDPDNTIEELACGCVVPPLYGTVERGPNHTVNYTPDANFAGTDAFTYQVCDPDGLCDTAVVTILVTDENDNPAISAPATTTLEDTPVVILVTHNDPDGDVLTCTVGIPSHGTVSPTGGTIAGPYPVTNLLVYTPNPNFFGTDNFTITCLDGHGGSDVTTVEITVLPVNDAPIAGNDLHVLFEDTPSPLQLDGVDPDGDRLTYAILTAPSHGTISAFDPATGTLVYTPDTHYHGPDAFTFQVCDPAGACAQATFSLAVFPVNDPPIATAISVTTVEDTPIVVSPLVIDLDGDPLRFEILLAPRFGTLTAFDPATGRFEYTPNPGFNGPDSVGLVVCDPSGACVVFSVALRILPVNDAPTASTFATRSDSGIPLLIELQATDPDGNPLVFQILDSPSGGQIRSFDPITGTLWYQSDVDFVGADVFSYRACDPSGSCAKGYVQVFVFAFGGGAAVGCTESIVISEIAWAGTRASPRAEWVELRNVSAEWVNLGSWMLRWRPREAAVPEEVLWNVLPLAGTVEPYEEGAALRLVASTVAEGVWKLIPREPSADALLVERLSDQTVADVTGAVVFDASDSLSVHAESFPDRGGVVQLIDPFGCVASTANVRSSAEMPWAAGAADPTASMERTDMRGPDEPWNWHTNLDILRGGVDASGHLIRGTPGAVNSPDLAAWSHNLPRTIRAATSAQSVDLGDVGAEPTDKTLWRVLAISPALGLLDESGESISVVRTSSVKTVVYINSSNWPTGDIDIWLRAPSGNAYLVPMSIVAAP